jgi:hypothetical protein
LQLPVRVLSAPAAEPLLAHGAAAVAGDWAAAYGDHPTGPTPGVSPVEQPDVTIYDTARRIWKRLAK